MNNKDEVSMERKFLHDLATPLTIVKLQSKRLLELCAQRQASEMEIKLLEQIIKAVGSMELMHANHKAALSEEKAS